MPVTDQAPPPALDLKPAAAAPPRRIAICGTAVNTLVDAPIHDTGVEIWTCSPNMDALVPRIDRHFEIHDRRFLRATQREYVNRLKSVTYPVYTFEPFREWPSHVVYPRREMIEEHGPEFLTSSPAWMMALAIKELTEGGAPGEIGLYGINMALEDEYANQRAGCWYFIKIAMLCGIRVAIPPDSDLLIARAVYPDSQQLPLHKKLWRRLEEADGEAAKVEAQIRALATVRDEARGRAKELRRIHAILGVDKL